MNFGKKFNYKIILLVTKLLRFGMQMGKQKSQYDEETINGWKSQIYIFQLIWTIKKSL